MADWKTYITEGYVAFDCEECGSEDVEDIEAQVYREYASVTCPDCGFVQEVVR